MVRSGARRMRRLTLREYQTVPRVKLSADGARRPAQSFPPSP